MALAQQLLADGRGVNGSAFFTAGMSSAADPIFLDDRAYRSSMNTVNRGGLVQTRPGYRQLLRLPDGRLQGCRYYRTLDGAPHLVSGVDGYLYASAAPFSGWSQLLGVRFARGARQLYWESAIKSVQREADGSLTTIAPRRLLLVQDGFTRAAVWDGATARHLDPSPAATAEATLEAGVVAGIEVTYAGAGYAEAPQVVIEPPEEGGTQARARAQVLAGRVTAVFIDDPGSGYVQAPRVYFSGAETKNETPIGGPMCWSGDRLWVAQGNRVYASDISDPLSFTENIYAAEGGFFVFPEPVVGMAEPPGLETPQLLVFTNTQTWVLQSGLRDRAQWKSPSNGSPFQRVLFPNIGLAGHRAVVAQYGLLWWFSMTGLTNLNAAAQSRLSSELLAKDAEMASSKGNLSPNVGDVALGAFENYLLCSAPSGDRYNRHTWVMDGSVATTLSASSGPAWNSVWTGTRPVEWAAGPVGGVQRIFYASKDFDGHNRIWEAFVPDRKDGSVPVTSFLETKTHIEFSPKATGLDLKRFVFAELHFSEIVGDLSVAVYWAGTRGTWQFKAAIGAWQDDQEVELGTDVGGYAPQSRVFRTPAIEAKKLVGSVQNIESPRLDQVDIGYSLLVVWTGRAALRAYRIFVDPEQEKGTGEPPVVETAAVGVPEELSE
jgi:hypothetical protein